MIVKNKFQVKLWLVQKSSNSKTQKKKNSEANKHVTKYVARLWTKDLLWPFLFIF